MSRTDLTGRPIVDEVIVFGHELTEAEQGEVLLDVTRHLKLRLRRTNRTKHGDTMLLLEEDT